MAESTMPTESTQTLEQSLNKTDFGHWMFEHRKSFIGAVIATFVLASGWLLYRQYSLQAAKELAAQVYEFEKSVLTEFRTDMLTAADLMTKFTALDAGAKGSPAMLPVALEAATLLDSKGDAANAAKILSDVAAQVKPSSAFYLLLVTTHAALLEKTAQVPQAISAWEAYVASGNKVILAKAYLELGRLYLSQGNTEKARANFDYIVGNYPNDELAKLARLYLQKMTAQP